MKRVGKGEGKRGPRGQTKFQRGGPGGRPKGGPGVRGPARGPGVRPSSKGPRGPRGPGVRGPGVRPSSKFVSRFAKKIKDRGSILPTWVTSTFRPTTPDLGTCRLKPASSPATQAAATNPGGTKQLVRGTFSSPWAQSPEGIPLLFNGALYQEVPVVEAQQRLLRFLVAILMVILTAKA